MAFSLFIACIVFVFCIHGEVDQLSELPLTFSNKCFIALNIIPCKVNVEVSGGRVKTYEKVDMDAAETAPTPNYDKLKGAKK